MLVLTFMPVIIIALFYVTQRTGTIHTLALLQRRLSLSLTQRNGEPADGARLQENGLKAFTKGWAKHTHSHT